MKILPSYINGNWEKGRTNDNLVVHSITQEPIATISSDGFDFSDILSYGRQKGKDLRNLTFHERANKVTALAKHLNQIKDKYYATSMKTGATLADSKIDVDGSIQTLFALASLARRGFPDQKIVSEAGFETLSRQNSFMGKHFLIPKQGVALLINAFNFPCWGMLEKLGSAFIAGVPAIVKPASVTSYLAQEMAEDIIKSEILPEGSLQLINGGLGNSFDYLNEQDLILFTGSAQTANHLQVHPTIIEHHLPFITEADSLNFAMLSSHAKTGDPEFNACVDEVVKEMTTKAGQRCTCIRRIFVPEALLDSLSRALIEKIKKIKIGNPTHQETEMGALVSLSQRKSVQEGVDQLTEKNQILLGDAEFKLLLKEGDQSTTFFSPRLLLDENPLDPQSLTHRLEVFGPVATLLPFTTLDQAIQGIRLGKGSLVGSLYSNQTEEILEVVTQVGAWHGRINLINAKGVRENPGHGNVMPHMIHGGPGRAGGGEELGGIRGMMNFLQRVAVQGDPNLLSELSQDWLPASEQKKSQVHPFKISFDQLRIGEGITTHRRTIYEADIAHFGCLSWDHFYAHFDQEAAQRSFFGKIVAHGYLILSAAAGLFVDPSEGPVLANVGLENLRFLKPVYAGDTIYAQLTCKEKTIKPERDPKMPPFGEVKWQVIVYNQHQEVVADYVILTLVKRKSTRKPTEAKNP